MDDKDDKKDADRVMRWVGFAVELVAIGAMLYVSYPKVRYAVNGWARTAYWTVRPWLRRARRIGEPAWLEELRSNHTAE